MSRNSVPLIAAPQPMDREAEVARINRELEILRDRYALCGRMIVYWKVFVCIFLITVSAGVLALATELIHSGSLPGAFFILAMSSITAFLTLLFVRRSGLRWIDIASTQHSRMLDPFAYYPDRGQRPRLRSYAKNLELQISQHEQRLSELTDGPSHAPKAE